MKDSTQAPSERADTDQPLLHDTIERLENEAKQYFVPLDEVFQGASNGELELLFQRPSIHPRTVLRPLGRDAVIGEPNILHTPDFLVLWQESCLQLLERPSALVSHTHLGYRSRSGRTFLSRLPASEADQHPDFPVQVDGQNFKSPETKYGFWGYWALWSDAGAVQYSVRAQDVFVRMAEFKRWRTDIYYPRIGKGVKRVNGVLQSPNSLLPEDMDDDHKSPALVLMCEAAALHWAHPSVVFDNPTTFPSDDEVAAWLIDKSEPGTFSKTSVKDAVRLIKPPFATRLKGTAS